MNLYKLKKNIVWWCLLLVILILPYWITGTSIAIILLLIAWIIEGDWARRKELLKRNYLLFLFTALFLIQVIGILYSENSARAYSELVKKLSILIFPIVLSTCGKIELTKINLILKAFAYNCFLVVLICLGNASLKAYYFDPNTKSINWDLINIQEFQKLNANYSHQWDSFSYMEFSRILNLHPTYLSLFLLFSILILVYLRLNTNLHKLERKAFWVLLFIFSIILVLLAARVVLITAVILAFFYLFKNNKNKYALGKSVIVLSLFIVLAGFLILNIPYTRFRLKEQLKITNYKFPDNHDQWNSTNLRIAIWYCNIKVYGENPLLGVGTGDFQDVLQACYQTIDFGPFYKIYNSHNQFLQIAVNSGTIGLAIFLACILWPFFKTKQQLYAGFLFIFSMACLTESMLQSQKGIVFYSLFNSLMAFHLATFKLSKESIRRRNLEEASK